MLSRLLICPHRTVVISAIPSGQLLLFCLSLFTKAAWRGRKPHALYLFKVTRPEPKPVDVESSKNQDVAGCSISRKLLKSESIKREGMSQGFNGWEEKRHSLDNVSGKHSCSGRQERAVQSFFGLYEGTIPNEPRNFQGTKVAREQYSVSPRASSAYELFNMRRVSLKLSIVDAFLTLTLSLQFDFEDKLSLDEDGLRHSTAVIHAIAKPD